MKRTLRRTLWIGYSAAMAIPVMAGHWAGWRGPSGDGVSPEKNLPLKWSATENLRWRVELPGPGNSSPIVWGDRVFVSQFDKNANQRNLMCFNREDGKLIWKAGVTYTENEPTQESNPYCAGTPATDGERVFVSFGSAGVYAYDFTGKEVWHKDLGKLNHMFGNSISPVLHGGLCILNFGPDAKARLVALKKSSGDIAWEVEPPKVEPAEQPQAGGPRGPEGPGGPGGGFGPGQMLAPEMFKQGDKNGDHKLNAEEFAALADSWFDKLDPDKTGKLSQDQFSAKFGELLPPPPGGGGGPGGGRGPGRMIGSGFFSAADADKDGSITRAELKSTFAKWAGEWDKENSGALDEEKVRAGLNASLPRRNFGGPGGPGGRGGPPNGSWSTPLIVQSGGHDELVASLPNCLAAFDPETGKQLWISKGLGGSIYSSPISGEGLFLAMSSGIGTGAAIAVKQGGSGDVSESQRAWKNDRVKSAFGSGVIRNGHYYMISTDGIAVCMDLKTGTMVWEERLKASGARSGTWSSMLLAGDRIYLSNQSGDTFVLRAEPQFEVLATNSVGESTNASLAASDGAVFLRTDKALWCFKESK